MSEKDAGRGREGAVKPQLEDIIRDAFMQWSADTSNRREKDWCKYVADAIKKEGYVVKEVDK